MLILRFALLLGSLALTLFALGCNSGGQASAPASGLDSVPALEALPGEAAGKPFAIPFPADPPRTASAPPTDDDRLSQGEEWIQSEAANLVAGSLFGPEYAGAGNRDLTDAAYAIYRFQNMDEYAGPARLRLGWSAEADTPQDVYAGFADYNRGAWRWYKMPASWSLNLPAYSNFISPGGNTYVAVVSLDNGLFDLDFLLLGANSAPVINLTANLNPDALQIIAPETITFDATDSRVYGGTIANFDFDWESDGIWDTEGDADGLDVHLFPAGNYTTSVRANGSDGQTSIATLSFTVIDPDNQAPQASFTRTPVGGFGPLHVDLDGSASSDSDGFITRYEWDIFSDGHYEISSDSPEADCVLAIAGTNSITLRVTDNFYATGTTSLNVELSKGWRSNQVDAFIETRYGITVCTTDDGSGERACVAYHDFNAEKLLFARAANAEASAWGAPLEPVNSATPHGFNPSMAVLGTTDAPIISYGHGTAGTPLHVVRATGPTGASWESPSVVESGPNMGLRASIAVLNTLPVIATLDPGQLPGQSSVLYYASTDPLGQNWNEPLTALGPQAGVSYKAAALGMSSSGLFRRPVLAVSGNNSQALPSFTFLSGSKNVDGTDWNPAVQLAAPFITSSIITVNGRPAYCGFSIGGSANGVRYVRSSDSNGSAWPATPHTISTTAVSCDMEVLNGKPFICYQELFLGRMHAVEALDADGAGWGEPYVIGRTISPNNCHMAMTVAEGVPVICYQFNAGGGFDIRSLSNY